MSNTLKVIDMVTKESQRIAHEKLSLLKTVDMQYDDQFKDTGGGKKGATIRVREPNQYTRRQGSRVMDVQDQDESTQNFTVAIQDGVDMRFNSAELIQSVNSDGAFDNLSKNYIEPAVCSLVSGIESDGFAYYTKRVYNVVGTAGTPITTIEVPGKARARLNQGLAPKDNKRSIQMDSVTMAAMVNGATAYFNPSSAIGEQYKEGLIARTSMADYYENERVWTLTNTSDVTGTTDAAAQVTDGGSTVDMGDTVADPAVGAVFTIAGVYACHPETKAAFPHLQQFVVLSHVSGLCTVSPKTILTGAKKNVCSSTGADLATTDFNSKTLTFSGAASTSYVQPIMYHKEAFQFVTQDLPLMDDAHKCKRTVKDGLSLRVWMASDIRNDELLLRLDILYGFAALRPAWACRLVGAASA